MKWLAVNSTMLSWDTYGRMAHNYYLYNSPGKGLTWIPWDNNESLMNRGNTTLTISLSGVENNWPLIRYLMDDLVYQAQYKVYVKEFKDGVFTSAKMNELFDKYHNLIAPYVIGPDAVEQGKYTYLTNQSQFTIALAELKQHVVNQNLAAIEYLK